MVTSASTRRGDQEGRAQADDEIGVRTARSAAHDYTMMCSWLGAALADGRGVSSKERTRRWRVAAAAGTRWRRSARGATPEKAARVDDKVCAHIILSTAHDHATTCSPLVAALAHGREVGSSEQPGDGESQ